eukprot:366556-Chlamydomonas_euryale.AAC.13
MFVEAVMAVNSVAAAGFRVGARGLGLQGNPWLLQLARWLAMCTCPSALPLLNPPISHPSIKAHTSHTTPRSRPACAAQPARGRCAGAAVPQLPRPHRRPAAHRRWQPHAEPAARSVLHGGRRSGAAGDVPGEEAGVDC